MKKLVAVILFTTSMLLGSISVVTLWDTEIVYEGQEIVLFEDSYYLARWWTETSKPTDNLAWAEIEFLRSPSEFRMDSLYMAGSAVVFNGLSLWQDTVLTM